MDALLLGLEAAAKRGIQQLSVRLDSELVVKQLRGEYRVKHAGLQPLYRRARQLLRAFSEVDIRHVPLGENALADRLVRTGCSTRKRKSRSSRRGTCGDFQSRSSSSCLRS